MVEDDEKEQQGWEREKEKDEEEKEKAGEGGRGGDVWEGGELVQNKKIKETTVKWIMVSSKKWLGERMKDFVENEGE